MRPVIPANNQIITMKKLIIYAICLFVLPAYSQTSKIKMKPEELGQFNAIKNAKSYFNTTKNTSLAHKKKTFQWNKMTEDWEYYTESNYEYSNSGLITKETIISSNGLALQRFSKCYDSNNLLIAEKTEFFVNNEWQLSYQVNFEYNSKAEMILEERRELINNTMELIYGYKIEVDTLNDDQEIIIQKSYNLDLKQYVNSAKEVIKKENGLNTEMIYYTWDGNNWVNESAEAYDYNNQAEIASILKVKWVNGQWQNEEMIYNIVWRNAALMQPYSFEMKTWDNVNWINESKIEYSYSLNGGITSTGYIFDDNQWKFQFRFIDEFDANKNRSTLKMELYEQNEWIVYFENRFVHTYDSQQKLVETITLMYDGLTWNNLMKEVYSDYRFSTGINNETSIAINVYPNPAIEILNFNLTEKQGIAKYIISDLSGRVVVENEIDLSNTNSINVQELTNGYYILNIETADKKYHQKFIKK